MPARTLGTGRSSKTNTSPPAKGGAAQQQSQGVLYARVSSKDQEKEGFSIPAQQRLLREYALEKGLVIWQEFIDIETAKQSGRAGFAEMLAYLKKHACRTILVEKTDRLYRNLKDWSTLDELGVTIHFVKENVVIGPDSRSSDQFVHGIKVLMARNYSLNLGEETRKGMWEKARSGIYPSHARVGYLNTDGAGGKRIIVPDPETAPVITDLFHYFDTGKYSVKSLAAQFRLDGRTLRGRRIHASLIHQVLRNRLYAGDFDWDGVSYQGTHKPLVSRPCWERVQELLEARAESKTRKVKHEFAFSGLIHCGHCGCHLVGELKKGRYVYYHCTGNRGKCPEPYTRQEVLSTEFAGLLGALVIPEPILQWLAEAVLESDRTEQAVRQEAIKQLQIRYNHLQARIETMYLDKLDGRITPEFFDERAAEWRHGQDAIFQKIQEARKAIPAPVDQAIDTLRLTSEACQLFLQQSAAEQRRLLRVVIKSAAWQDGTLRTTLFEPFEILRHSNRESYRKEMVITGSGKDLKIWLLR